MDMAGIFVHECEDDECDKLVQYDDEPYCFDHSPDSGSSVFGYSASNKAASMILHPSNMESKH